MFFIDQSQSCDGLRRLNKLSLPSVGRAGWRNRLPCSKRSIF